MAKTQKPAEATTMTQESINGPKTTPKPPVAVHGPTGPVRYASDRERLVSMLNLNSPTDRELFASAIGEIERLSRMLRRNPEDPFDSVNARSDRNPQDRS